MYIGTILIILIFSFLLIAIIYNAVKDNGVERSLFVAAAIFVFCIGIICVGGMYRREYAEIEHPYTKTYTIKVHYIDGGTEIKTFNCEGWQEPYMKRYYTSYSLIVGDYEVRNVTRYYVLGMEKHY